MTNKNKGLNASISTAAYDGKGNKITIESDRGVQGIVFLIASAAIKITEVSFNGSFRKFYDDLHSSIQAIAAMNGDLSILSSTLKFEQGEKAPVNDFLETILDMFSKSLTKVDEEDEVGKEGKKTYRFTLEAHHEIDIEAENYEEASKKADAESNETFGGLGTFGEAVFMGIVNEKGKVELDEQERSNPPISV